MKLNCYNLLCTALLVLLPALPAASETSSPDSVTTRSLTTKDIKRFQTKGDFGEIKDFLVQSITERGIKISSTSYISKMLERTREDVGGDKHIYKNAEAIGFCSATLSRQMMESDSHHIVFCPYTIVIYELASKPGTIYLSFRRPFYSDTTLNDKSLADIDTLLTDIIKDVIE